MHHERPTNESPDRLRTISRLVFLGFVAIAAYYLITEHRAHLFGILPFLLLAACPLLHLFHHRGHGDRNDGESGSGPGGSSGQEAHRH